MKSVNDSIFNKMLQMQKELKNQRQEYSTALSIGYPPLKKVDTLLLRDTIFRDPDFELDTVFGDKWFKQRLHLKYPGEIASSPEVTLENYVALENKRETVKPPKKFFL